MGPILSRDHTVVKLSIILLSNVNTSFSAANGGQNLHKFIIFLQDIHLSANHHCPSHIPGTHRGCEPDGRTTNKRDTTLLKCTNKSGAEENRDDTNHAPYLDLRTAETRLGPQRRQGRRSTTSGHTAPEEGGHQLMWSDDNRQKVQDDTEKRQQNYGNRSNQ